MPRPLTKPHLVKLRLTDSELAALRRLPRPDEPLGPAIVRAALGDAPEVPAEPEPSTPKEALAAFERRWLPSIRRTAPMFRPVRDALDALARALG